MSRTCSATPVRRSFPSWTRSWRIRPCATCSGSRSRSLSPWPMATPGHRDDCPACNVHVAPGLGNALGSLYNAAWYGSPVIVTAGAAAVGLRSHRAAAVRDDNLKTVTIDIGDRQRVAPRAPLHDFLALRDSRGFFGLASGGIGFAIAGAIGIQLAQPQRPLVAIIGDGSAMYSIQALCDCSASRAGPSPISFAMTAATGILKERLLAFKGMAAAKPSFPGMDLNDPPIDFVALAQSMGVLGQAHHGAGRVRAGTRGGSYACGARHLLDVMVHGRIRGLTLCVTASSVERVNSDPRV